MFSTRTQNGGKITARTTGKITAGKAAIRLAALLPAGLMLTAFACASDNSASSNRPTSGPAERALADPFNYQPSWNKSDTDIGGGGIGHFDKDAFNRDLNDFLNP